ncbi:MAG TPA: hypothetical protein VHK91_17865 [Flavisolibacter sp.]|jgi:hypothetical protein|nr:hypothetical protein [Flavisolibacter sp.]
MKTASFLDKTPKWLHKYLISIFLSGMVMLGFGIFLVVKAIQLNHLACIRGTLQKCDIYTNSYRKKSRYGMESDSQTQELIFYLKEHQKKFEIREPSTDAVVYQTYLQIKLQLEHADSITVWVRQADKADFEPDVIRIEADHRMVSDSEENALANRGFLFFLLIMGLGSMVTPVFINRKRIFESVDDEPIQ